MEKRGTFAGALVLFWALFGGILFGKTYYVAPNGSDRNDGSQNAPFRTIQKAADVVRPGDTVYVLAGEYQERVVIKTSGTPGNPIVFEGERGSGDQWLTVIDGGDRVTGWKPAPEVGRGVYKHTGIGYAPYNLTVSDKLVARIKNEKMNDGSGFRILDRSPEAVVNLYDGTVKYWDGIEALYGNRDGVTYLRFRNYDDPNDKEIETAPNGSAGVLIRNKSYIVIRNFKVQNAYASVYIDGKDAHHNIIENNYLQSGRYCVLVVNLAGDNHIRYNEMTMNAYGHDDFGAWEDAHNLDYKYRVRQHMYANTLKGDNYYGDRCIFLNNHGDNNEVYGNHLFQHLSGIGTEVTKTSRVTLSGRAAKANYGRNLKIYDNTIHNTSSTAIRVAGGEVNLQVFNNLVYDNNLNFRIHDPTIGPIYIYNNRFYNPIETVNHFYYFFNRDYSFPPDQFTYPEIFVYHNSFGKSKEVLRVSSLGAPYGLPNTIFLNNIFDVSKPLKLYAKGNWTDPQRAGYFDYNWHRGTIDPPWWSGQNNIQGSQPMWPDYPPDFKLPENSEARNAGLDLSRRFTIKGKTYDPLPGMSPGYFSGSRPDLGIISQETGTPPPPGDTTPPSAPKGLKVTIIEQ